MRDFSYVCQMKTPIEKAIDIVQKEQEENYDILNNESNYHADDYQAVRIYTNFIAEHFEKELQILKEEDNQYRNRVDEIVTKVKEWGGKYGMDYDIYTEVDNLLKEK